MSSPIAREGERAALEQLVRCLTDTRLSSNIEVAGAALIYFDWLLTSGDELDWLWRRSKSVYARTLFTLARYPALASAIVGLVPLTITLRGITTYLSVITIISSELILAMRTWAMWQSSPWVLASLIVLAFVCAAPGVMVIQRDVVTAVVEVVPSATWSSMQQLECRVSVSAVDRAWIVPYIGIMVFEVVVFGLTLYKVLRCYRVQVVLSPKSKLLEALWIDGLIYFIFMIILGLLNIVLAHFSDSQLRIGFTQLQTMTHSVLSTRIVLHTGRVLREGAVEPHLPTNMLRIDGYK